ncbi:MAG: hypothetical protein Q8L68_02080 [Methylococcales bacterium]|nr:hypothetical protein [Methylococcales bacterium]
MTHTLETTNSFVNRMKKTAAFSVAPLIGLYKLFTGKASSGDYDFSGPIIVFFLRLLAIIFLPIILAATLVTLALGIPLLFIQATLFPMQYLIAGARDYFSDHQQGSIQHDSVNDPVFTRQCRFPVQEETQAPLSTNYYASPTAAEVTHPHAPKGGAERSSLGQ